MKADVRTLVQYRNCAEELRALASDNHTSENRLALFRVADAYDKMADAIAIEELLKEPAARLL